MGGRIYKRSAKSIRKAPCRAKKSIKRSVRKSVKKSIKRSVRKSVKKSVKKSVRKSYRYRMGYDSIKNHRRNTYPCRNEREFSKAVYNYKQKCRLDTDMNSTIPYSHGESIDRTREEIARYEDSYDCLAGRIEVSKCFPHPFDDRDRAEFLSYSDEDRNQIRGHFGSMSIISRWLDQHRDNYDRRFDALNAYDKRMKEMEEQKRIRERAKALREKKKNETPAMTPKTIFKRSNPYDLI